MKEKTPFLSIIVPAYNIKEFISPCLDSILQQSFTDFEVILVDDGSTDGTASICDVYAGRDDRIKVIHKKNGGLVSARKAGILASRGEYVGYVDGDDWIKEDMFQSLCEAAVKESADMVICDFISAGENLSVPISHNMPGGIYEKDRLEEEIYPVMLSHGEFFHFGFYPAVWCKLFRKEILLENQLAVNDNIKMGEDVACFYPCLLDTEKIVYLKENYLYFYRMRDTSISHSMIRTFYAEEVLMLIESLQQKFCNNSQWKKGLEKQLYMYEAYMLDNLFTPHIRLKELFFNKTLHNEIRILKQNPLFIGLADLSLTFTTSSRTKRIINMIRHSGVWNRMELLLFRRYEQLQNRFHR